MIVDLLLAVDISSQSTNLNHGSEQGFESKLKINMYKSSHEWLIVSTSDVDKFSINNNNKQANGHEVKSVLFGKI